MPLSILRHWLRREFGRKFWPTPLHYGTHFIGDGFDNRSVKKDVMNLLQLRRHHQLAADDAGLIGKVLAIASMGADWLSSFVGHDTPWSELEEIG